MSEYCAPKKHARNAFSISVLGSHKELQNMMSKRDMKKDRQLKYDQGKADKQKTAEITEDELDADIPF